MLTLVAAVAVAPAPALARGGAPPGLSGVDEYVESLPSDDGTASPINRASGGAGAKALPPGVARKLARAGADGRFVAAFTKATGHQAAPEGAPPNGSDSGSSGLSGVFEALTGGGSGGMGAALPILLGLTLLGACAVAALRLRSTRRRPTGPHP